jgi:hypothetical protein
VFVGSQVLGVYVYSLFFQYTAIEVFNYLSVFLGVLVYGMVMSKFVRANQVATA